MQNGKTQQNRITKKPHSDRRAVFFLKSVVVSVLISVLFLIVFVLVVVLIVVILISVLIVIVLIVVLVVIVLVSVLFVHGYPPKVLKKLFLREHFLLKNSMCTHFESIQKIFLKFMFHSGLIK